MKNICLGIEIGGTKLQIFEGTNDGRVHSRSHYDVVSKNGARAIQNTISEFIRSSNRSYAGIGIGFGGPVNSVTGKVICSHQVAGWSGFIFKKWMRQFSKAPVFVENDANVAALAEATLGSGKRYHSAFYVTLGSGVGGGLVVDKKIYHGAVPGESEIGHLVLKTDGTILEHLCSGWAVDLKMRSIMKMNEYGSTPGKKSEASYLPAALKAGDHSAKKILNETAEYLALGLSHVVHLMHPEIIILGGGLSLVGKPLLKAVSNALQPKVMKAFKSPVLKLAKLKQDTVPIGALLLCAN